MITDNAKLTDDLLSKVACRVNELMLERFDADRETASANYVPSKKFKKAASEIIENHTRKHIAVKTVRRVIIIAAILIMLFICTLSVSAVRSAICKFIFSLDTEHAAMSCNVETDKPDVPNEIINYREPSYIPDGFELIKSSKSKAIFKLYYGSDNGYFIFSQNTLSSYLDINTENAEYGEININGHTGFYSVFKSQCVLTWNDGEYIYIISSDLDIDTVLAIAESVY